MKKKERKKAIFGQKRVKMSFSGHGVNTKSVDIGLNYLFVQLSTFKKKFYKKISRKTFFFIRNPKKSKRK